MSLDEDIEAAAPPSRDARLDAAVDEKPAADGDDAKPPRRRGRGRDKPSTKLNLPSRSNTNSTDRPARSRSPLKRSGSERDRRERGAKSRKDELATLATPRKPTPMASQMWQDVPARKRAALFSAGNALEACAGLGILTSLLAFQLLCVFDNQCFGNPTRDPAVKHWVSDLAAPVAAAVALVLSPLGLYVAAHMRDLAVKSSEIPNPSMLPEATKRRYIVGNRFLYLHFFLCFLALVFLITLMSVAVDGLQDAPKRRVPRRAEMHYGADGPEAQAALLDQADEYAGHAAWFSGAGAVVMLFACMAHMAFFTYEAPTAYMQIQLAPPEGPRTWWGFVTCQPARELMRR